MNNLVTTSLGLSRNGQEGNKFFISCTGLHYLGRAGFVYGLSWIPTWFSFIFLYCTIIILYTYT